MAMLSTQQANLSANVLTSEDVDVLLRRIREADEVSLQLNVGFRADLPKVLMLAAALSRRDRRVNVHFGGEEPTEGVLESLAQTLLGPVLGYVRRNRDAIASHELGFGHHGYVDKQRRIFCAHTSRLDCESRERFLNDIGKLARLAAIEVDASMLERIAALAFEPNQNAEEHGSVRIGGTTTDVFRFLVARVHDQPGPDLSDDAHNYIRSYELSHARRTRWLEVVVVDAGMGLAYPRFYVRARAMGAQQTDVYEAGYDVERGIFTEMLCRGRSTKGFWGSVRSSPTTTGQGHKYILRNVLRMHAYASVRAGRCHASISFPSAENASRKQLNESDYVIGVEQREMFGGTVWQLLVPLDQQLQLAL